MVRICEKGTITFCVQHYSKKSVEKRSISVKSVLVICNFLSAHLFCISKGVSVEKKQCKYGFPFSFGWPQESLGESGQPRRDQISAPRAKVLGVDLKRESNGRFKGKKVFYLSTKIPWASQLKLVVQISKLVKKWSKFGSKCLLELKFLESISIRNGRFNGKNFFIWLTMNPWVAS